jgi:putative membrane protein
MDGGFGMGFGGFYMIIFWVLVIIVVIFLVRTFTAGTKDEGDRETALDILKKRYATGEITKDKFEEKRKALT